MRFGLAGTLSLFALIGPGGAEAEDWRFSVVPYVWLAGLSGDVATLPGLPPAEIDLSFSDVLENLDIAAFGVGEARRGDLFLRAELSFARIGASADTPGPAFSGADLTSKTTTASLMVGHTLADGASSRLEGFAGLRGWIVDTELDLNAGVLAARRVSESESFIDPIVGLSGTYRVAPDWTLGASGSIGGFGVGADIEWGLTGLVTWEAGDSWALVFGYRYLAVDYEDGDFVFDVAQQGPLLGARFDF